MGISDVFNIQSIDRSNVSLAKVLLIFYVLIASTHTEHLMAKQMKQYIDENRLVQHIIGFLTMFILVTLVGGIVDTRSAIFYSLIGYIWFIFSTKLDIQWNIIIMILLFIGYIYENSAEVREKEIMDDPNLSKEKKLEAIQTNNYYKTLIVSSVILTTIVGTLLYSNKKHEQYGGGYDVFTYLLY
jgi:hypothetical protein